MIVIDVAPLAETRAAGSVEYAATTTIGAINYASRSCIPQSALSNLISQLAEYHEDQPVVVAYPTVELRHRSLWDLAGIRNREERQQRRSCIVCHATVTGRGDYCSPRCRKRASRQRQATA